MPYSILLEFSVLDLPFCLLCDLFGLYYCVNMFEFGRFSRQLDTDMH